MPTPPSAAADSRPDESNLFRSYAAVVVVEIVVLVGLYWLGRHFG
jgi:hypothetical protein